MRTHTAPEHRAVSWHRNESELAFATAQHGTARSHSNVTIGGVSPRVVEGLDIAEFVERINSVAAQATAAVTSAGRVEPSNVPPT